MGYFIYPFHLSFMHDIEFYHHCEVLSYVSPQIISFTQFQISALFVWCSHLHCHCPGENKQIKKTPRRLWIESDIFNSSPTCQCTNLLPMVHPNKLSCSVLDLFLFKQRIYSQLNRCMYSWNIAAIFVTSSYFQLIRLQGSLFLVYRGETSLLKTPYFQRIYKKLSQTPILGHFYPFLPIFTYKHCQRHNGPRVLSP